MSPQIAKKKARVFLCDKIVAKSFDVVDAEFRLQARVLMDSLCADVWLGDCANFFFVTCTQRQTSCQKKHAKYKNCFQMDKSTQHSFKSKQRKTKRACGTYSSWQRRGADENVCGTPASFFLIAPVFEGADARILAHDGGTKSECFRSVFAECCVFKFPAKLQRKSLLKLFS